MSELQSSSPNQVRHLTPEEVGAGVVLGQEEVIAFDIAPNPSGVRRQFDLAEGRPIEGAQIVAELHFGGEQTYALGQVINTEDAPDEQRYGLLLSSPTDKAPKFIPLYKGQLMGIGRSMWGQEDLPTTVSRDHCAVGLDQDGRFVVENHNPSNMTAVRSLQ